MLSSIFLSPSSNQENSSCLHDMESLATNSLFLVLSIVVSTALGYGQLLLSATAVHCPTHSVDCNSCSATTFILYVLCNVNDDAC